MKYNLLENGAEVRAENGAEVRAENGAEVKNPLQSRHFVRDNKQLLKLTSKHSIFNNRYVVQNSFNNLSRETQVLMMLKEQQIVTTNDFRRVGICAPAAAIATLRNRGYNIHMYLDYVEGNQNPMGHYSLMSEPIRIH